MYVSVTSQVSMYSSPPKQRVITRPRLFITTRELYLEYYTLAFYSIDRNRPHKITVWEVIYKVIVCCVNFVLVVLRSNIDCVHMCMLIVKKKHNWFVPCFISFIIFVFFFFFFIKIIIFRARMIIVIMVLGLNRKYIIIRVKQTCYFGPKKEKYNF